MLCSTLDNIILLLTLFIIFPELLKIHFLTSMVLQISSYEEVAA